MASHTSEFDLQLIGTSSGRVYIVSFQGASEINNTATFHITKGGKIHLRAVTDTGRDVYGWFVSEVEATDRLRVAKLVAQLLIAMDTIHGEQDRTTKEAAVVQLAEAWDKTGVFSSRFQSVLHVVFTGEVHTYVDPEVDAEALENFWHPAVDTFLIQAEEFSRQHGLKPEGDRMPGEEVRRQIQEVLLKVNWQQDKAYVQAEEVAVTVVHVPRKTAKERDRLDFHFTHTSAPPSVFDGILIKIVNEDEGLNWGHKREADVVDGHFTIATPSAGPYRIEVN